MRIGHSLLAGQGDEAVRARVAQALGALMSANGLVQVGGAFCRPRAYGVRRTHSNTPALHQCISASLHQCITFYAGVREPHCWGGADVTGVLQSTDRMNLRRFRKNLHSFLGAVRGLVRTK